MDSKKVIEKLIKIAESQQKIISRLAQATDITDKDPMSGDLTPTPQAAPSAPAAPVNKATPYNKDLLAPVGSKLTEQEWNALLKQRFGLDLSQWKAEKATDPALISAPGVANPEHGQQAVTNAPGTQGGPPKASKPNLTPTETKYLDLLKKKNQ
jgi:hypothetical protein